MGGASSVSPAPPTAGPAAAVGVDKQAPERGAADGAGQATETEQARRKSALLRANEAVLFNFIRKNVTLHRPAIPLIEILKESKACNNFQRYIRESLVDDLVGRGMDEKTAESAREMAFNYLQFWLDASDFNLFSASSFRNFRADKICERYLEHGARNQLPFSRLMVDEIMQRRDAEATTPGDLFSPAQNEAYEFLEAEVLPLYLSCEGPTGYRLVHKLTSVVAKLRRAHQMKHPHQSSSEALIELHSKLSVILWDPLATRAFKDYLSTINAAELLIFFLEVTDFKEMFTAVLAQEAKNPPPTPQQASTLSPEKEMVSRNFHYFLTRAHKIYDKYLKLGSPLRDLFSEKDLEELVQRVSTTSELNPSLFDDLKEKVFEYMLVEHFGDFQKSEQNQTFQRLVLARSEKRKKSLEYIRNRRKMLNVAQAVNVVAYMNPKTGKVEKRQAGDAAEGGAAGGPSTVTPRTNGTTPRASLGTSGRPSGIGDMPTSITGAIARLTSPNSGNPGPTDELAEIEQIIAEDTAELMQMLHTNTSSRFQQYLMEQQEAHKLLFWFEIEDFKSIPHTQTAFVQGRAQKVFDKYIKRGAPLELMLESSIRNQLVGSIDKAHLNLFDNAQQAIFDSLLQEEWPLFKQHELYQEYLKEKEDRRKQAVLNSQSSSIGPTTDMAFVEVLSSPIHCASFKKFVETEFCVEPLMFWLEVEEYKRLPRSQYMQNRCRKIVNRYIRVGAPMAISITPEARQQAMERMEDPGPLCFQAAENEVYTFMETCLLPKFRKSAEYSDLLRTIENERKIALAPVKPEMDLDAPLGAQPSSDQSEGPTTLKALLGSQAGVKFFKEFLVSRHCEENLLFWLEAEDFKDIPGKDFLKIRARKIVNKYIVEDAKQQVNIPHTIREELLKSLDHPGRNLFQKAQMEIFKLIQKDSFPPFLNSEQFKAYQDLMQGTQESNWGSILRRRSYVTSTSAVKDANRVSAYEKSQT